MPTPVFTPRINNNDDTVRLAAVLVEVGAAVRAGDPMIDVETDKATFTVEAPVDGFLLKVLGSVEDTLDVGSTLAWLGDTPDEPIPGAPIHGKTSASGGDSDISGEPTLKALLLLKAYGLTSADVPAKGTRLGVADVEKWVAAKGLAKSGTTPAVPPAASAWSAPDVPGILIPFTPEQKGMARTVTWHRDEAAAGYIELAWDPAPWEAYAADFQKANGLMMNPLLSLLAWRLAAIAKENPRLNATVGPNPMAPKGVWQYDQVNLGFTVQAGTSLYVAVLRDAGSLAEADFVRELGALQRAAMKHALSPEQSSGATIAFTSMARWKVTRHIPILPPNTGLIVAHTATINGSATVGASYDHRLLTGFDVVQALQSLVQPPALVPPGQPSEAKGTL